MPLKLPRVGGARSARAAADGSATAPQPVVDLLAIGLGNPGAEFEDSRHNYGARAVQLVAERHGANLKPEKRTHARTASIRLDGLRLVLAVPQTFMNESGMAVAPLARRYLGPTRDLDRDHLVVVHDELDLPPGQVRVKQGGGLAGNNGLRSIRDHLHHVDFIRVRIGIGKPPSPRQGVNHVLRRPSKAERELLAVSTELAADAVETILVDGLAAAMNRFNTRS